MRERQRETERETERNRDRERQKKTQIDRGREIESGLICKFFLSEKRGAAQRLGLPVILVDLTSTRSPFLDMARLLTPFVHSMMVTGTQQEL